MVWEKEMAAENGARKPANVCGIVGFALAAGGVAAFAVAAVCSALLCKDGYRLIAVLSVSAAICTAAAVAGFIFSCRGLVRRAERSRNVFALAGMLLGAVGILPAIVLLGAWLGSLLA
ncbi:MAG TPA: hypothetical protein H9729_04380 [Candidatus Borkfalkia excrementigallinarum]|uniref:DUF4190 domain-containing protein n=1 Tax=Candidatus Borkfalkia excrementigallinarum TaxID=2838506 RepID=A0A9D1ZW83_9FIRM|nr:hypothetical protein [Candidatus Borkfalkia excrementigallinarum]